MKRMVTKKDVVETVNQAIEEGEIEVGSDLPEYSSENEGQVLKVISDPETGNPVINWEDESQELPEIQSGDAGKVLQVNSTEDGVEWGTSGGGGSSLAYVKDATAIKGSTVTLTSAIIGTCTGIKMQNSPTAGSFNTNLFLRSNEYDNWSQNIYYPNRFKNNIMIGGGYDFGGYMNSLEDCIISGDNRADGYLANTTNDTPSYFYSTIFLHQDGGGNTVKLVKAGSSITVSDSIIACQGESVFEKLGGYPSLGKSLIMGKNLQIQLGATDYNSRWPLYILGVGHNFKEASTRSLSQYAGNTMVGRYGIFDDSTNANDILMVGAGTSTSDRANCFATGNDGTEDYIKIGNTKITESQLQSLLALLNA